MEKILCAAIYYNDGKQHPHQSQYGIDSGFVIGGYRHHNIIGAFPLNSLMNGGIRDSEQGFITSTGRFVDRYEAMKLAFIEGQVDADKAISEMDREMDDITCKIDSLAETKEGRLEISKCVIKWKMLFSEDLY